MAQAEIKTKLTADGSDLFRALDQGVRKASDFRTQVGNLGKTIGAAFTATAAVAAFNKIADAQIQSIANFHELERRTDAFKTKLEQLREKTAVAGLSDGARGIGGVVTDYTQELRRRQTELQQLHEMENVGGMGGVKKWFGDLWEKAAGGGYTKDELLLSKLQAELAMLEVEKKTAQKKADELRWKDETKQKLDTLKKQKAVEDEWLKEDDELRKKKAEDHERAMDDFRQELSWREQLNKADRDQAIQNKANEEAAAKRERDRPKFLDNVRAKLGEVAGAVADKLREGLPEKPKKQSASERAKEVRENALRAAKETTEATRMNQAAAKFDAEVAANNRELDALDAKSKADKQDAERLRALADNAAAILGPDQNLINPSPATLGGPDYGNKLDSINDKNATMITKLDEAVTAFKYYGDQVLNGLGRF